MCKGLVAWGGGDLWWLRAWFAKSESGDKWLWVDKMAPNDVMWSDCHCYQHAQPPTIQVKSDWKSPEFMVKKLKVLHSEKMWWSGKLGDFHLTFFTLFQDDFHSDQGWLSTWKTVKWHSDFHYFLFIQSLPIEQNKLSTGWDASKGGGVRGGTWGF